MINRSHISSPSGIILNRAKVPNIVMVGATGSGKSTVGPLVATLLGFGCVDIDAWIEKRVGMPLADFFTKEGEPAFRVEEGKALEDLGRAKNQVIIAGAGCVETDDNKKRVQKMGAVVWLHASLEDTVERLMVGDDQIKRRPLLSSALHLEGDARREALRTKLEEIWEKRSDSYTFADVEVRQRFITAEEQAAIICRAIYEWGKVQPIERN